MEESKQEKIKELNKELAAEKFIKRKKVNYLNKRDLLKEIVRTKNSYSSFLDPQYEYYDIITEEPIENITDEQIEEAKRKRIDTEFSERKARLRDQNVSKLLIQNEQPLDISTIPTEDIVVRVMTWDHIPEDLNRVKKKKKTADYHVKCEFPPYKHYIKTESGWKEVGRSHWEGGFNNGYFSQNHGRFTHELCRMMKLLVEKYAQKGNFRGYCVDETTEALTNRGWKTLDEITKDDLILSLDLKNNPGSLQWSNILDIYIGDYDSTKHGKMFHLTNDSNTLDALITPGHKMVVRQGNNFVLKKVEDLTRSDNVVLAGALQTEDPPKAISNLVSKFINYIRTNNWENKPSDLIESINILNDKEVWLLASEIIEKSYRFYVSTEDYVWMSYLLALVGFNTKIVNGRMDIINPAQICSDVYSGESKLKFRLNPFKNKGTVDYKGRVWCPQTEFGTFLCRRNGITFITGNTYNDEMRSRANLQLMTVGLQFNEAKTDNPFAYYTKIVHHAFVGVINEEKKSQEIRDDILIDLGVNPSFSRQVEHELKIGREEFKQRHGIVDSEVVLLSKQYGRKKS